MTEAEWRAAADPFLMLTPVLCRRLPERKLRLYHAACCRLIQATFAPPGADELIDLAERCADGLADPESLRELVTPLVAPNAFPEDVDTRLWPYAMLGWYDPFLGALEAAMWAHPAAAADLLRCVVGNSFPPPGPVAPRRRLGRAVLSVLVKLAGGSPHQPAPEDNTPPAAVPLPEVVFDSAWRTEAVVGLAHGIYDDRAFERLPVLADALEDAGCADLDLLNHCRGGGLHARGCWVVDAVLGLK